MAESLLAEFAYTSYGRLVGPRTIVTPDVDHAYVIGKIHATTAASANLMAAWVKWTRTGGVWASGSVQTLSSTPGGSVACWYDKWTPGNTGNKIHIIWHEERTGTEGVYYANIDLDNSDAVSTPVLLENIAAGNASLFIHSCITICVARSGRICVGGILDDTVAGRRGFWTSDNGGVNWTKRAHTPFSEETGAGDYFEVFPGGETDPDDVLLVQLDRSANTVDLWTYDASANSWGSKTNITACIDFSNYIQFAGVQRHSDNHILLAVVNDHDTATTDMEFWDIASAASIVQKTNVWSNSADQGCVAVGCDQQTNGVYVTWIKGDSAWPGSSNIVWERWSLDGGSTWESINQPNTTSGDFAGVYVAGYSVGDEGGHIGAVWFDAVNNELITDFTQWSEIAAAAGGVPEGAATLALDVGLAGTGYVMPGGSASMNLGMTVQGTGYTQPMASATLDLETGLEAEGYAQPHGATNLGLEVAMEAEGYALAGGAASLDLDINLTGEGYALSQGAAALDLDVDLAGVGEALVGIPEGAATLAMEVGFEGEGYALAQGEAALELELALVGAGEDMIVPTPTVRKLRRRVFRPQRLRGFFDDE